MALAGLWSVQLCLPLSATVLTSSINTSKFSVGDRIRFTVTAITPKGAAVTPPVPESDFSPIIVKEWNLHKTEREKSDSLVYEYLVTTYTPEPCTIPQLSFILENNGSVDTLRTEAIPLQIISVLPSDTVDILDLKAPLSAGKRPKWWLWLVCSILGIAALTATGILLYRHFRKPPPPPPPVPPYEEAIDALAGLGAMKYLQRGLVREFVFALSEIFKRYIGRRFDCNAADFTTEEMIAWSGAVNLHKQLRSSLEWFFTNTDPVKFARLIPDNRTVERFETEVRSFLEATKPAVQNRPDASAASGNGEPAPENASAASGKGADA
jgi:hypothetical protein